MSADCVNPTLLQSPDSDEEVQYEMGLSGYFQTPVEATAQVYPDRGQDASDSMTASNDWNECLFPLSNKLTEADAVADTAQDAEILESAVAEGTDMAEEAEMSDDTSDDYPESYALSPEDSMEPEDNYTTAFPLSLDTAPIEEDMATDVLDVTAEYSSERQGNFFSEIIEGPEMTEIDSCMLGAYMEQMEACFPHQNLVPEAAGTNNHAPNGFYPDPQFQFPDIAQYSNTFQSSTDALCGPVVGLEMATQDSMQPPLLNTGQPEPNMGADQQNFSTAAAGQASIQEPSLFNSEQFVQNQHLSQPFNYDNRDSGMADALQPPSSDQTQLLPFNGAQHGYQQPTHMPPFPESVGFPQQDPGYPPPGQPPFPACLPPLVIQHMYVITANNVNVMGPPGAEPHSAVAADNRAQVCY